MNSNFSYTLGFSGHCLIRQKKSEEFLNFSEDTIQLMDLINELIFIHNKNNENFFII